MLTVRKIDDTRPSMACGVTVWRKVIEVMVHTMGPARSAVGQKAERDRQQQERNGLRGSKHADLARPGTEQQHRNNGRGGKAQLLGRLGRQVGAHQKSERSGKRYGHG